MRLNGARLGAVFRKEFVQMRRDRMTFAIMVMMPVMQILLFGYAINTDPRNMPAVVEMRDDGPTSRSILAALKQSSYFRIVGQVTSAEEGDAMLRSGRAQFMITIPEGFERRLVRGERPQILIAADASDPVASSGAVGAIDRVARAALARDLSGALAYRAPALPPYEIIAHARYNPEGETSHNIVPGLLGIILTMTLVLITSIALTREAERGTLESLLATPVRPHEVMIGKTTPYIFVAFIQIVLVLLAARFLFDVPFEGSALTLALGLFLFVCVNLVMGFLISTASRSQMQAMQLTLMIFLPSILLSGFMFPFAAMPLWARAIGECIPVTHFVRIVRKVMLKGASLPDVAGDLWPLLVILGMLTALALVRYRRTLD